MSSLIGKLHPPNTQGTVPRPRLFQALDRLAGTRVTWIAGNPGAGKTTVAAAYSASRGSRCFWYQVDESDREAGTLAHYFKFDGGSAFAARRGRYDPASPDSSLRRLLREELARLPDEATLVVDDFHRLGDSAAGSALLDILLEGTPGARVLITSREEPPSRFARFVANRLMGVLGPAELRLTSEEARAVLAATPGGAQADPTFVIERADGWAAGVVLLAARGAHGPAGAIVDSGTMFDYFAEEVVAALAPEIVQVLYAVAWLPQFTAAIASAVSGREDAGERLGELVRLHVFIERLDGTPPVFRLHPLFREFLCARCAQQCASDGLRRLLLRGAQALASAGQPEDAVPLLVRAGEAQALAALALEQGPSLIEQGRGPAVLKWLGSVSEELVAVSFPLLLLRARAQQGSEPARAREDFERAFANAQASGDGRGALAAAAGAAECIVLEWSDMRGMDRWIDVFEREIERGSPLNHDSLPGATAAFVYRRPEHPACARLLGEVERELAADPRWHSPIALGAMAYHAAWLGGPNLDAVLGAISGRIAAQGASARLRIWWHCTLAFVECVRGDPGAGLREVARAGEVAAGDGEHGLDAIIALRGSLAALGGLDVRLARRFLEAASGRLSPARFVERCTYERLAAWVEVLDGNIAEGVARLRAARVATDRAGMPVMQFSVRAALAIAAAVEGAPAEAQAVLDEMRRSPVSSLGWRYPIQLELIAAYIADRRGESDAALRHCREALARGAGRPEAFGVYELHPAMIGRLAEMLLAAGDSQDVARAWILRFRLPPPSARSASWPWRLRVHMLGDLRIERDGIELGAAARGATKPFEMLAFVISRGGEASATEVQDALWPEADGDAAKNSFDQTLFRLRRLLEPFDGVSLRRGRVAVDMSRCWADVGALAECAAEHDEAVASRAGDDRVRDLTRELQALYRGPFLHGALDASWVVETRRRLERRALEKLGDRLVGKPSVSNIGPE